MNKKRVESFLNKNFESQRTEDDLLIYDIGDSTFIILGPTSISFYFDNKNYDLNLEYIAGIDIISNRLNFHFWENENFEKTLSINLTNTEDYFISDKLSEAIFKIDVDDPKIKRFFVKSINKGSAIKSIKDQYPGMVITGISKFSESINKESLSVGREAVSNIFEVYNSPDTDRIIKLGIDWTMSNLFGNNWPAVL